MEGKRFKHQNVVTYIGMSEKDGNSPLFLATTKMCTHSVFILLCKVKNLIDNHVKLRGKLKYGHFIS